MVLWPRKDCEDAPRPGRRRRREHPPRPPDAPRKHGYEVEVADSGEAALALVDTFGPDVILTDVRMPKMGGLDLLATLKAKQNAATVIVMSAYGNVDLALEAMKAGAYDYVQQALQARRDRPGAPQGRGARDPAAREPRPPGADPEGEPVRVDPRQEPGDVAIFRTISKIADYKTTVLISGESGVGKELVARAMHARSSSAGAGRSSPINCGAIPENLLESELFGHRKGRVHRRQRRPSRPLRGGHDGTLFLDEIGELPLALQVKLLRVLQEESIRRLGDTKDIKVDVRIIAATHRDLSQEAKAGRFREDLFYRINVLPIAIPPLRERREDIPLLIDHFVARNNARLGTHIRGARHRGPQAPPRVLLARQRARAREHHRAGHGPRRERHPQASDLPERIREALDPVQVQLASGELSIKKTTAAIEEILIRRALQKTKGNRTRAAEVLEISHRALLYKIKDYKISDL